MPKNTARNALSSYSVGAFTIATMLFGIFAAAGCSKGDSAPSNDPNPKAVLVEVATAETTSVHDTLALDGQFVLSEGNTAKLAPMVAGRLTKVFVREGDNVSPGQLVASVDTRVQDAQAQSASQALASATASARQIESSLRAAEADQKSQLEAATLALETAIAERDTNVKLAELDLQRTRAGARPQEIRTAEQALLQARVTRDRTKIEADRDQYLLGKGFIAARQANDSMAAYELAKSAFEQAQSQLDLLKEGARQEDLHAAEERLRSAKDLGAKKISEARVALRQADEAKLTVQAKRSEALAARLTAAEKAADAVAAKAAVQNGEVRSPMAGTVTHRFMNVGDMADPTLPIYEIASSGSTTDFVGQVAPEEAARIKEGMPAEFPNSPNLSGRVVAVGIANMQSGMTAVRLRVVGAKIETGKFATARIILRVLPDAVVIPRACVVTRDTGGVVFVDKGGVAKMTSVRLGPVEGERVAILSGVARGDTVILVGQHELSDGAPVTTKSRAGS